MPVYRWGGGGRRDVPEPEIRGQRPGISVQPTPTKVKGKGPPTFEGRRTRVWFRTVRKGWSRPTRVGWRVGRSEWKGEEEEKRGG